MKLLNIKNFYVSLYYSKWHFSLSLFVRNSKKPEKTFFILFLSISIGTIADPLCSSQRFIFSLDGFRHIREGERVAISFSFPVNSCLLTGHRYQQIAFESDPDTARTWKECNKCFRHQEFYQPL